MEHSYEKLMDYAKREERERILGIIEYYISELSDDTTAERLAKKWLRRCVTTVERLDAPESPTRK